MSNLVDCLDCSICFEPYAYSASSDRCPVTLVGCGHTICRKCCTTLDGKNCAFCKVKVSSRASKPNYTLIAALEALRVSIQSRPTQSAVRINEVKVTRPKCGECRQKDVSIVCGECKQMYCADCNALIHQMPTRKSHVVAEWTESHIDPVLFKCSLHTDYNCDLVCLDTKCKNSPICMMCSQFGAHKGHNVIPFADCVTNQRESLQEKVSKLNLCISDLSQGIANIKDTTTKISNEVEVGAINSIKAQFNALRKQLDSKEASMIAKVESLSAAKTAVLNNRKAVYESQLEVAVNALSRSQTLSSNHSDRYFALKYGELTAAVENVLAVKVDYNVDIAKSIDVETTYFNNLKKAIAVDQVQIDRVNSPDDYGVGYFYDTSHRLGKKKIGESFYNIFDYSNPVVTVGYGFDNSRRYLSGGTYHLNISGQLVQNKPKHYYNESHEYVPWPIDHKGIVSHGSDLITDLNKS